MFIARVAGKNSLAPEERNVSFSKGKCFAPLELQSSGFLVLQRFGPSGTEG